jgi:hypothetical protein
LAAGGFFWLDLESLDPGRLEQFGRSLRLDASATAGPKDTGQSSGPAIASTGVPQRPSVAASVIHRALVLARAARRG